LDEYFFVHTIFSDLTQQQPPKKLKNLFNVSFL